MIAWKHVLIKTQVDLMKAKERIVNDVGTAVAGAFDTETTGLHPVCDVPFLFQCGYYKEDLTGVVYVVDIEQNPGVAKAFISWWNTIATRLPLYLGHHVVFDLHMLENIKLGYKHYTNLSDTQYYIRAASDAIQTKEGGEPLALKDWAVRHIDKDAAFWEHELKTQRSTIAKEYNAKLLKATGWKKKKFDEFFEDMTNDASELPTEIKAQWDKWHSELPQYLQDIVTSTVASDDIRYDYLDRDKVIEYSYKDIEYTLEIQRLCTPVIDLRDNWELVRRENLQIQPLFEMERVGFLVDKEYLITSKLRTKEYIRQRRQDLITLAGEDLTCNQNTRIKQILEDRYRIEVESTGAEVLELTANRLKSQTTNQDAVEFIETILELRTLEKWYSTYIRRFDKQLTKSDRIYTSIHQVGTVSGRVSCDFQQFPKAGLISISGEELFDPRRMVIVDEEYPAIIYLDYSAQELRVQALFTYLIGAPDYNMMRAYSPYKCHTKDGLHYNPENPEHRTHAYDWDWYNDSDGNRWKPTDLHGAMTKTIFPDVSEEDPKFHDLRYVGKRTNFAKNYGASYTRIREMFPEFDDETCHKIDEAYYKTFPGVKAYHEACYGWAKNAYMDNLYGVKYYGVSGHKLRNVLIQGTSAYMTKDRIANVSKYLHEHNYKSKLVMQIHDEIQLYWHKDDPLEIFFEIQKIMQDVDSQVPIVSDMEVTTTTWKAKQEVATLDELKEICHRS